MRHHQKYFSVHDGDGNLAPYFIAVMNTSGDPEGLVRHGNERVLRARFNDALFFWHSDLKRTLHDRLPDLAKVTFQAKLGSYLEKTHRNVALVKELGGSEHAQRAALLAKCDLTTDMVREFTDLQGVVGGLYAKEQGEPEAVWRAIYDQYKPLSMEDAVPSTRDGQIVALADKLDTLRECFRVGLIPSGSKDPFALRRAAQGVVRILVEGLIELPLNEAPELQEFLHDRIRYYFREVRGYKYDEVNAVLASGIHNLPDVGARLEALRQVRPTENFEPLAASFKRIQNILRQANFSEVRTVDEALLEAGPERELYDEFQRVRRETQGSDYLPALEAIAGLRPTVDRFFDKVLVNAPDDRIRRNRLTLLSNLLTEFSAIADFSEIVPANTGPI
jgi:glycyl-tRNA synthetase beta chain